MARTRERHAEIRGRLDAGESLSAISRVTGLDRKTVQRFARAGSADELLGKATSRESRLDEFKPYICQRWNHGVTDAAALHAELQERGWAGSVQTVRRYVRPFRQAAAAPGPAPAVPKTRQITRWLLTRPDHLQADEQAQLAAIRARCPHIDALAGHVTAFAEMMTARTGSRDLEAWLTAVEADDQAGLRSLATGIRNDQQAVTNGLTLHWNSGRVEGTVNIQDQDDQAPDVRSRRLRPAPQTRHLAPCVTGSQNSRQSPEIGDPSVEVWVGDLETVVDAVGLERFALLGVSQGAAIAVAYAARHPDRVCGLVLYGGYARGRRFRGEGEEEDAIVSAIRAGWTAPNPAFRRMFSMLFLPNGTPEQMAWYEDLLRRSTTAGAAARLYRARGGVNVSELAPQVRARTLVMHARDDRVVPVEESRLLAALIPDAHFVLLESANHILLEQEPAWDVFRSEIEAFLGTDMQPSPPIAVAHLSGRELEVLELVSEGLTNEAIADRLCLSARTVERHLTNIYAKLHVSGKAGRAAAAALFVQLHQPPRFSAR